MIFKLKRIFSRNASLVIRAIWRLIIPRIVAITGGIIRLSEVVRRSFETGRP